MREKDVEARIPYESKNTYRGGKKHHKVIDPRWGVAFRRHDCTLTMLFEPGDLSRWTEIRLTADGEDPEPWRFFPREFEYLRFARAYLTWDREGATKALRALQPGTRPRRGDDREFYEMVADVYKAVLAEGETKRPLTELAARLQKSPSTAGRWVKEARKRGLLEEVEQDAR